MGGALALDAAWLFAAFLVLLILAAAGIAARRFLLERGGGTVECGLRKGSGAWRLGVASYQREELYWFGVFRVSMRPEEMFPRRDLTVVSRRLPSDAEAASLGPGMIVVECQLGEGTSSGSGGSGPGGSGAAGAGVAAAVRVRVAARTVRSNWRWRSRRSPACCPGSKPRRPDPIWTWPCDLWRRRRASSRRFPGLWW